MKPYSKARKGRVARFFRRVRRGGLVLLVLWTWQVGVLLALIDAYARTDRGQPADVIIVLGSGLRRDNSPGPALIRRSTRAADLWKQGLAPLVICSGGKPGNRTRSEADACAELLRGQGVPAEAIILEDRSRSTEENAIESQAIMQANGWQTAVIVSDRYHLFRANHIFQRQGVPVYPSPVDHYPRFWEALVFNLREVAAIHWQVFKEVFNIPLTYVQGI